MCVVVFCKNKDVNYLDENFMYYTSKTCGDQVCKSCYNNPRVFAKREVQCPGCGAGMKKSSLVDKPKDVLDYEREKEIRANVLREFNLTEDEFDTEEDYRKYYELAECVIYKQFNRIDLDWAERKMEENRRQNRLAIARNASKRAQDIKRLQEEVNGVCMSFSTKLLNGGIGGEGEARAATRDEEDRAGRGAASSRQSVGEGGAHSVSACPVSELV